MTRAATFLVGAYGVMLLLVGIAGIFTAEWELRHLYDLNFGEWPKAEATFLSQYRFLKGVEMGAGTFCLILGRAIMSGGRASAVFLLLIAGGIIARSLAWVADGTPSWPMLVFLGLETLVLVVYLVHLRQVRAR